MHAEIKICAQNGNIMVLFAVRMRNYISAIVMNYALLDLLFLLLFKMQICCAPLQIHFLATAESIDFHSFVADCILMQR